MKTNTRNAIYGLALGDATAYPYEFLTPKTTRKHLAAIEYDYANPQSTLQVSDDTQMSIYLLQAFFEWKEQSQNNDEFIEYVADSFLIWLDDFRNTRAPGNACISSLESLKLFRQHNGEGMGNISDERTLLNKWGSIFTTNSMGSGTVMRAPWMGLLYAEGILSMEELVMFNKAHCILTHGHKAATDAALLTSLITAHLVTHGYNGKTEILDLIEDFNAECKSREITYMSIVLETIPDGWFKSTNHEHSDVGAFFPRYWTATYVLGSALAILFATVGDPIAMMKRCMINSQDSDTVGAVAGAFLGACSDDENFWMGLEWNLEVDYIMEIEEVLACIETSVNTVSA